MSLFFEWPKKSNQKKGHPVLHPCGVPSAPHRLRGSFDGTPVPRKTGGIPAAPLRAFSTKDSGAHSAVRFGYPAESSVQHEGIGGVVTSFVGTPTVSCLCHSFRA